jgi:hypothetical protein
MKRLEIEDGIRLRTVGDRLRERFVQPLAVDRLCALIGPAMKAAKPTEKKTAFESLQDGIRGLSETPRGAGLDVPDWLRRLEAEVQHQQATRSPVSILVEEQFGLSRRKIQMKELVRQLEEWDVLDSE